MTVALDNTRRAGRALPVLSGQDVRDMRRLAGLSLRAFAERCGVSHTAISVWETGKRPLPAARCRQMVAVLQEAQQDAAEIRAQARAIAQRGRSIG